MAKIVTLEQRILKKNSEVAAENRRCFDEHGAFVVSLASSPGSGKTSLLEVALGRLRQEVAVGVIEGDVQTDNDARRIEALGLPAVQVVTNGTCHLDAQMVQGALEHVPFGQVELLFIENVGNLVCPASYDLGEHLRVVVASVTEGEEPKAPVYVDGRLFTTLRGDQIVPEFIAILNDYVAKRYSP